MGMAVVAAFAAVTVLALVACGSGKGAPAIAPSPITSAESSAEDTPLESQPSLSDTETTSASSSDLPDCGTFVGKPVNSS
jgi:hypothetical protein